ncbi:hypothetical protein [Kitasatospora sp. NPDC101183]|uniref:hypothetical protein n=1 Tax=Kitasatospora sp. NPDC101183 TaxID=3364100 RepID=UPI003816B5EE
MSRRQLRRTLCVTATAIGSLATATTSAGAATAQEIAITNPAFLQPRVGPNNLLNNIGPNDNRITGWRVLGANVDIYGTTRAELTDGYQAVDLNGNNTGGIEQAVSVPAIDAGPKTSVTIGFQAKNNNHPDCPKTTEQKFHVQFAEDPGDRVNFTVHTVTSPGPYRTWQHVTAQFNVVPGVRLLQFVSDNAGYCSALVTKVTASATRP